MVSLAWSVSDLAWRQVNLGLEISLKTQDFNILRTVLNVVVVRRQALLKCMDQNCGIKDKHLS